MGTFYVTQEGPVNALALNRDYTQVIIGGRNGWYCYVCVVCFFTNILLH